MQNMKSINDQNQLIYHRPLAGKCLKYNHVNVNSVVIWLIYSCQLNYRSL